MADITLSPVPYNGGTLSLTGTNSHMCNLSDSRFFAIFGQTTPNYTFGAVVDVANLRSSSPTVTVTKQRVIDVVAPVKARVWKLASNRVLVLNNGKLNVFEIDGTGDIIPKVGNLPAFHSTFLWGTESVGAIGTGEFIYGKYIKDNTVWFIQRTSTTSAITFFKVEYNTATDTLTKTAISTLAASTTASHVWRFHIQKLASANEFLVYALGGNTTMLTDTITTAYIYDDTGVLTSTIPSVPASARLLVGLLSNKILALSDSRTWLSYDGAAWTTVSGSFAGSVVGATVLLDASAIDADYFMVASTTSGSEPGLAAGTFSYRVSRFIDAYLGQSSPSTNTGNGLSYATLNPYFDQDILNKVDYNTYVTFGRGSTTTFRIRTVYKA